ncbi:MAG: ComEC/Rec2 family competence protein [Actinomycetota bacterium]
MTHDVRLVPAAAAAWLAAAAGLTFGAEGTAGPVAAAGAGLVVLVLLVRTGSRPTPLALQVLLCAAVAIAVLLSARAQVEVRISGGFEDLRVGRAEVEVRAVALEDARILGASSRSEAMVRLRLESVSRAGGTAVRSTARVTALGGVTGIRRGDRVALSGTLAALPAQEDSQALLLDSTVAARASPGGAAGAVQALRGRFLDATAPLSPQGRGLVPGITIGDDSALPETLLEAMRRTSLGHLTAVSGAHIALVLAAVGLLAVRAPTRLRAVLLALALAGLVALVGPEESVVRAAAMGCTAVVAILRGRPPKALPALATAIVLLLVLDPWLAFSFGFALSASATAALLLLAPALGRSAERTLRRAGWRPRRHVAGVLATPLAAHLACAPIILLFNPSVSLYGVLANAVAAPAVAPATLLGLASVMVSPLWLPGATGLARAAEFFTGWIAGTAMVVSRFPASSLPWPQGLPGALALAVLHALFVLALLAPPPRWPRPPAVLSAVVVASLMVAGTALLVRRGEWSVFQCDVGQGSALLVRSGVASAVMVDVGPEDGRSQDCLTAAGVTHLDLLVLTHPHADHIANLPAVLAAARVDEVLISPAHEPHDAVRALERELVFAGLKPRVAVTGDRGMAGTVAWEVLWPSATPGTEDANDLSVAVLLTAPGGRVLALGDLQRGGQEQLANEVATCGAPCRGLEVVAMAHHGSRDQDPALATLLDPAITLVSVGADNAYGHPTVEAMALYEGLGTRLWRTDVHGALRVTLEDGTAVVEAGR